MIERIEEGVRVRLIQTQDLAKFLWGATGIVIKAPSEHAMRERKFVHLDKPVIHPYGGILEKIWVDESMVEIV